MAKSVTRHPFGTMITAEDILETLNFLDGWEDRYKYIIDLGKELPAMTESLKNDQNLVRGCQSQVWIDSALVDGKLHLHADSDAFIVKGLLGVILAAYNGKSPESALAFDVEDYLSNLGLMNHLSVTRGNGLRAMIQRVKQIAVAAQI